MPFNEEIFQYSLKDLKVTLCQDFMANINLSDSLFSVHMLLLLLSCFSCVRLYATP